jgi:hypothetical protein
MKFVYKNLLLMLELLLSRKAEDLILAGRIKVNGSQSKTKLGTKVIP